MTCDELQARYLAGDLDDAAAAHMRSCASCRSAAPAIDRLREELADPLLWEQPSESLAERVVSLVLAELGGSGAGPRRPTRARLLAGVLVVVLFLGVVGYVRRPHWVVDLAPTPTAPAASATVAGWNTETGTRMELQVAGLTPAGAEAYYEIWLTAPDGRHVSAGTFRDAGSVTAWAGVTRAAFPRIWVTLEPADDDPAPSSVVVLDTL